METEDDFHDPNSDNFLEKNMTVYIVYWCILELFSLDLSTLQSKKKIR